MVEAEVRENRRILYRGPSAIAFVPVCARYPYEAWVTLDRRAPSLAHTTKDERADLARAIQTVVRKFDGLWKRPFPYLMVLHQAPTDGGAHPESHFRFEFTSPYR